MIPAITDFFSQRVYGKQFLDLFEQMAYTITNEYVQDVFNAIETTGCTPSFEELMEKIKALTNELTMRATWIREDYKEGKGRRSVKLTMGCKKIINKYVEEYMRRTKTLLAIRNQELHAYAM